MRTTSRLVNEDAARMAAKRGNQPGATPTAVAPTRRDKILAARTDNTFDAKRAAYTQQGQSTGHSMDEAGNITSPAPAAVKPGGRLIPGHSPGSSIWQPDAPTSQSGQPGQSVLPPTLKRPAAPRTGGLINNQPAAEAIAGIKTAQAQIPRQTARNAEAPPAVQLPTVASAIKPPVTNNVTRNVTSPVTPASPSQGPAARALADFNAANPNVMTVAQTDALAAERRGQIANAQNTLKTQREAPHRQLQKDMMQPYAPTKQLNTGIASIDAVGPGAQITSPAQDLAEAIRPGVNAQRAQQGILPPTPAPAPAPTLPPAPSPTIANNSQPPQTPPPPGYFAQKAAANPGGIISKGIEAAGMFKNSLSTGAQNITAAAQAVAPVAVPPLRRLQQGAQSVVKTIGRGIQTQADRNKSGVFSRILGTKTAANYFREPPPAAANPNIFTGAEGVAYTDTRAAMRRGHITDAQNTLKTQRPPAVTPPPAPIASAPGTPGQAPSTPAYMPPMKTVPGQNAGIKRAVPAQVAAVPQTPPLQPKMAVVPGQRPPAVTPPLITPKTLATRPTAQRSQLALGR
jgi:hypothetical protein